MTEENLRRKLTRSGFRPDIAYRTQECLSRRLILQDRLPEKIGSIAGVDVAYLNGMSVGAAIVLDYESLQQLEGRTIICKTAIPYIPGLLFCRETAPAVLSLRRLQIKPDVILVEGHGLAHPRRCGFASYLGLITGKPTVGVAKTGLIGHSVTGSASGDIKYVEDMDEIVGAAIVTKMGCRPIFVSAGHMVSLQTAIRIARHCTKESRLPEPILKAHQLATAEKRKINIK